MALRFLKLSEQSVSPFAGRAAYLFLVFKPVLIVRQHARELAGREFLPLRQAGTGVIPTGAISRIRW